MAEDTPPVDVHQVRALERVLPSEWRRIEEGGQGRLEWRGLTRPLQEARRRGSPNLEDDEDQRKARGTWRPA